MRVLWTAVKWLTLPIWVVPWIILRVASETAEDEENPDAARARTYDFLAGRKEDAAEDWEREQRG